MSLPDDETREPDDNLTPDESSADSLDEQLGPISGMEPEPEVAKDADEVDLEAEDVPVAEEDEVSAAPAEGIDETLEFAAPAETESGIAFDSVASEGEAAAEPEEAVGDEFLAGLGGLSDDAGEFSLDKGDEEAGEGEGEVEDEEDGEDQEKPEKRMKRILAAIGGSDPYTVLMGIALLALLVGVLFFLLELSAYDFDIGAERARQLVGSLGFGWLL